MGATLTLGRDGSTVELDGSLQYLRKRAPQWRPGTTTHHHGHADHQAFLESPFQEAMAAIHQKMHEHGIPH